MEFIEHKYKLGELPDGIKDKIYSSIRDTKWSSIDKLYFNPSIIDDDIMITIAKRADYHGYALINDQIIVASLEPIEVQEIEAKIANGQ
jgi:hypothetical protein